MEIWGHQHQIILQAGRVTHLLAPETPEEGKDEAMAALNEKDPVCDRFRAINEDAPVTGLPAGLETGFSWVSKVVGDPQTYNQLPPKEGVITYSVNVIKSLRWPGAVTVA